MKKASLLLIALATLGFGLSVTAATSKQTNKQVACSCKHDCSHCSDCTADNECHAEHS